MLVIWGLEYSIVFWVGNCVYSLFNSPLFPSMIAWADKYVKMTAVAIAIIDVATGLSMFSFTWLAGYFFQQNGAQAVLYLSMGGGVVTTITLVVLQILASYHGNRFDETEEEGTTEHMEHDDQVDA
jgi:uncharacterized membrane protein